jgi:hypothetical protein
LPLRRIGPMRIRGKTEPIEVLTLESVAVRASGT